MGKVTDVTVQNLGRPLTQCSISEIYSTDRIGSQAVHSMFAGVGGTDQIVEPQMSSHDEFDVVFVEFFLLSTHEQSYWQLPSIPAAMRC